MGWDGLESLDMLAVSLGDPSNLPASLSWLSLVMGKQFLAAGDFHMEVSNENSPTLLGAV